MFIRIAVVITALSLSAMAQDHAMLPNPKLTPGATDPKVTQKTILKTICQPGYTATVRNVTAAEKRQVMERYGLPESELSKVEIDHFISLEIGGSNDITNLWPEYYDPATGQRNYLGARDKDVIETHFHREICAGAMTLLDAQERIKHWPEEYKKLKGGE